MHEIFRDIKANTTSANHGNFFTQFRAPAQHIKIAVNMRAVLTGNLRITGHNTGGHDDFIKGSKIIGMRCLRKSDLDFQIIHHGFKPVDKAPKFLFSRHLFGQIKLTANFIRLFKNRHAMATLGRGDCGGKTSGASTNDCNIFGGLRGLYRQLGFKAGPWIDQTRADFAAKCVVQTGLITGDAWGNLCGLSRRRLGHKVRICQKRPRHADHIGAAGRKHIFSHFRGIDAI